MSLYAKELDRILKEIKTDSPDQRKRLLLHSCCAPCSSYVLEFLRKELDITVFYYNPNITMEKEYQFRKEEQKRLIEEMNKGAAAAGEPRIRILDGEYEPKLFFDSVKGLEDLPEGRERCFRCYALRLCRTAKEASEGNYDFFTTTLTISPMKNAAKLNEIGERYGKEYSTTWLPSDFKKKDGYKRSVELSEKYGLYRQNYCGCVFSKKDRMDDKTTGV